MEYLRKLRTMELAVHAVIRLQVRERAFACAHVTLDCHFRPTRTTQALLRASKGKSLYQEQRDAALSVQTIYRGFDTRKVQEHPSMHPPVGPRTRAPWLLVPTPPPACPSTQQWAAHMDLLRQHHEALDECVEEALKSRQTETLRKCIDDCAQDLNADDEKVPLGHGAHAGLGNTWGCLARKFPGSLVNKDPLVNTQHYFVAGSGTKSGTRDRNRQ